MKKLTFHEMTTVVGGTRAGEKWGAFWQGACIGAATSLAIVGIWGPATVITKALMTGGAVGDAACSIFT